MRIERTLAPGETFRANAGGNFIYIRRADAPVDVQVNGQPATTLNARDQLHSNAIHTLDISNPDSQPNAIQIDVGYGQFRPAGDGQQISVGNFPSVQTVQQSGPVTIGNWPKQQAVNVSNWPTQQTVSVSNWKSVQAVKQSGPWQVSVSNQPPRPSAMNSGQITIASGAGSLAANPKRITLIIKAGASNSKAVFVDHYPLEKGEVITLSTPQKLAMTGNTNDTIYYIEELSA